MSCDPLTFADRILSASKAPLIEVYDLTASAALQRHRFIEGQISTYSLNAILGLREQISHHFDMAFEHIRSTFPPQSLRRFFNEGGMSNINPEALQCQQEFDLALYLACILRFTSDRQEIWYWHPTRRLITPAMQKQEHISSKEVHLLATSIRRAAVESLPSIILYAHIEQALVEGSIFKVVNDHNTAIQLKDMLVEEAYNRASTPEEERNYSNPHLILEAAQIAVEKENISMSFDPLF